MSYVPRRIQTIKKDGKTETISDQEFSALEAPLVLLGEPGAGTHCCFGRSDLIASNPCTVGWLSILDAKWLTSALRDDHLSVRRLKTLLYSGDVVLGPLRVLHAWLAALDKTLTDRLVVHGPYGCLRYGDVEQYSVAQARHLIAQLQNLATADLHFRGDDWGAQVGAGLARKGLRSEIVDLIRNPDVPYQLSTIVLESLNGTELFCNDSGGPKTGHSR